MTAGTTPPAALPVMAGRRRQWFDLNDGKANVRPPFVLEATNFMFDLLPERRYRCQSEAGKVIEKELIRNTRPHEVYRDDRVVPETFDVGWCMDIDEFGPDVKVSVHHAVDGEGMSVGFGFNLPITNLAAGRRSSPTCSATTCPWRSGSGTT